jgi:hypothetical protein
MVKRFEMFGQESGLCFLFYPNQNFIEISCRSSVLIPWVVVEHTRIASQKMGWCRGLGQENSTSADVIRAWLTGQAMGAAYRVGPWSVGSGGTHITTNGV